MDSTWQYGTSCACTPAYLWSRNAIAICVYPDVNTPCLRKFPPSVWKAVWWCSSKLRHGLCTRPSAHPWNGTIEWFTVSRTNPSNDSRP